MRGITEVISYDSKPYRNAGLIGKQAIIKCAEALMPIAHKLLHLSDCKIDVKPNGIVVIENCEEELLHKIGQVLADADHQDNSLLSANKRD